MSNDRKQGFNSVEMLRLKYAVDCKKARNRIIEYRKGRGMNQSDFAEQMGILQNYVSRIEKGEVDFVIEILFGMRDAFGLSPDWILYGGKSNALFDSNIPIEDNNIYRKRISELLIENAKLLGKIEILKEMLSDKKENVPQTMPDTLRTFPKKELI